MNEINLMNAYNVHLMLFFGCTKVQLWFAWRTNISSNWGSFRFARLFMVAKEVNTKKNIMQKYSVSSSTKRITDERKLLRCTHRQKERKKKTGAATSRIKLNSQCVANFPNFAHKSKLLLKIPPKIEMIHWIWWR